MGAHARGAVADAFLDGGRGALDHVLDGEGVLDRRHPLHGEMRVALGRRARSAPGCRTCRDGCGSRRSRRRPAGRRPCTSSLALPPSLRRDRGDAAVLHADVGRRLIRLALGQPHVTQDEIEIHRKRCSPLSARMLAPRCACCTTETKSRNAADREDGWINSAKRNPYSPCNKQSAGQVLAYGMCLDGLVQKK